MTDQPVPVRPASTPPYTEHVFLGQRQDMTRALADGALIVCHGGGGGGGSSPLPDGAIMVRPGDRICPGCERPVPGNDHEDGCQHDRR